MDEFPSFRGMADLTAYVEAHPFDKCWTLAPDGQCLVQYPFVGPPPPHQPKVCRFRDAQGRVCGIGGHTSRTHNASSSVATKALTHAVWIIRNMNHLGEHHFRRHVEVLLNVLCSLEDRRRHYQVDATADIHSILVMYAAVLKWVQKRNAKQGVSGNGNKRQQRSTISIVNDFFATPPTSAAENTPLVLADVPSPKLVVFLFPTSDLQETHLLRQRCLAAFLTQDILQISRMAQGHFKACSSPSKACTCQGVFIKVPRINEDLVCCHRCGLAGHNKATCQSRTTATHVAVALATLLDPDKATRISAKTAHLTLYHCYDVLVTLLYQWCFGGTRWDVGGGARIKRINNMNPELLLRFYNHTVASLKKSPTIGPTMQVMYRRDCLMLEAAHAYDQVDEALQTMKHEAFHLRQTVSKIIEDRQDDDLERFLWMDPEKAVSDMIRSSTQTNPRIADDLALYSFDDVFFDE
jgi:hypothetical protein